MNVHRAAGGELVELHVQVVKRNVFGLRKVLGRPFAFFAGVDNVEFGLRSQALREFGRGNSGDGVGVHAGLGPRGDSALEVAQHAVVAYAGQTGNDFVLTAGFAHDHQGLVGRNQGTHPRGELAVDSDVDGSRNVSGRKVVGLAGVEHECVHFAYHGLEGHGLKRFRGFGKHFFGTRNSLFVHGYVHREVGGGHAQSVGYFFDELFAGHVGAKGVVGFELLGEGSDRLFAHVLAAGRTGSVARVDRD